MVKEDNKIVAKTFQAKKIELVTKEDTYILELSNQAVKKADELGFINKISKQNMGLTEMISSLLYKVM